MLSILSTFLVTIPEVMPYINILARDIVFRKEVLKPHNLMPPIAICQELKHGRQKPWNCII